MTPIGIVNRYRVTIPAGATSVTGTDEVRRTYEDERAIKLQVDANDVVNTPI
jgi:hypothetical protein